MQGASRQPVNAEEMLAELKRVVELSTPPPSFRLTTASMVSKSSSFIRRAQIDKESEATADNSAESGQPTVFRKATTPIARSWKLAAGGLALAGTAMIGATFALMNRAPDLPQACNRPRCRSRQWGRSGPKAAGRRLSRRAARRRLALPDAGTADLTEPSQVATPWRRDRDAMTAPARSSLPPAGGEAVADAPPQPASFGLESVAPAFTQAPANGRCPRRPKAPQTATQ